MYGSPILNVLISNFLLLISIGFSSTFSLSNVFGVLSLASNPSAFTLCIDVIHSLLRCIMMFDHAP